MTRFGGWYRLPSETKLDRGESDQFKDVESFANNLAYQMANAIGLPVWQTLRLVYRGIAMRGALVLLARCGLAVSSGQIITFGQSSNPIRKDVYTFQKYVFDLNAMRARISSNMLSAIQDCSTGSFACLKIQEPDGLDASFIVPWKCGSYSVGTSWHQNAIETEVHAKSFIFKGGFPYASYVISNKSESILYLYSPEFGIVGISPNIGNFKQRMVDLSKTNSVEDIFVAISTLHKFVQCRT